MIRGMRSVLAFCALTAGAAETDPAQPIRVRVQSDGLAAAEVEPCVK